MARAGEYLKQVLGDIGIELELRYEDVPTWLKRIYHNYDFVMNLNYFYQLPDPVLGVHRHYGTDQIRKGTHFKHSSRYSNPELDKLLASGAIEANAQKRTKIYREIQEILARDMPVVNLFELQFLTVYNTKLKGAYNSALCLRRNMHPKRSYMLLSIWYCKQSGIEVQKDLQQAYLWRGSLEFLYKSLFSFAHLPQLHQMLRAYQVLDCCSGKN
jgi:hypothetical protein